MYTILKLIVKDCKRHKRFRTKLDANKTWYWGVDEETITFSKVCENVCGGAQKKGVHVYIYTYTYIYISRVVFVIGPQEIDEP